MNQANKISTQSYFAKRIAKTGVAAAVAVACAGAGAAFAQTSNVTIYGIVDTGYMYQSKVNDGTGKSAGSQTYMATNGMRQSILGFKGEEALGNGMSAFFNLEHHFDTNNGSIHTGADGTSNVFWRRQSNVGLKGDWGSLTFGRQYGPALLAHLGTEPRIFKENFSNLYGWALGQIPTTFDPNAGVNQNTNNDVGIFFNNAAQYRNTIGPVSFGILYSTGNQLGNASSGNQTKDSAYAVGVSYTGPITLSGSYQEIKAQTTTDPEVKHTSVGFAVPFDNGAFKANWMQAKLYTGGTESNKFDDWGVGVDYKWSGANTLTLAYYDNKDKLNTSDQQKWWVLSNDYSLSKRTTLYGVLAYADLKPGATFRTSIVAQSLAGALVPGEKTTFLNVGINHSF